MTAPKTHQELEEMYLEEFDIKFGFLKGRHTPQQWEAYLAFIKKFALAAAKGAADNKDNLCYFEGV